MNSPIKVTEIAFTGYPVTDIPRARAFYEGVLNLKESVKWEHEGKHWIEYDVGPATLALSNMSADQWKPNNDGPSTALEVEDFEGAVTAVREFGSTFYIEPMDTGVCQMAIVGDPDGNSLIIHKRKAQEG